MKISLLRSLPAVKISSLQLLSFQVTNKLIQSLQRLWAISQSHYWPFDNKEEILSLALRSRIFLQQRYVPLLFHFLKEVVHV